ncbi:MAG TPA: glutamate synthase subunit alpha, partial [Kiritimatiellae bacterium]|nr:glutamate synthase subunit alpha [Kiritimatiellia bacterium]
MNPAGAQPEDYHRSSGGGGLYEPRFEHDSCGVGFVCNLDGSVSHKIIENAIVVLSNLIQRGATGADSDTGDGAGVLMQLPDRFFRHAMPGLNLPRPGTYGVGMMFLPCHPAKSSRCRTLIESNIAEEGFQLLGWRRVPVNAKVIGRLARQTQPDIRQCFVHHPESRGDELERKLYILRRRIEKDAAAQLGGDSGFYIPSFSSRTIVYKGLMMGTQLSGFYQDLLDPRFESALAVVHQRYSTNTFPSWDLAQPFRFLAHNGEINTLRGNLNWMRAREPNLRSELFGEDIRKLLPITDERASDSANLDSMLELLVNGGRDLHHAMVMLIPQAWGAKYPIGPDLRGFFEYHAGLMEPWDGPAAVAFTDGRRVGALLDRNGLRPARYTVTREGLVVLASEAGVLQLPSEEVIERGALRPGQIILADLRQQRLLKDREIKMHLARRRPYRRWVQENQIFIHGLFGAVAAVEPEAGSLARRQQLFGYAREDIRRVLDPMAVAGHEPVGSMGADEPLAVLSEKPQLLYWYFKQLFA